MIRQVSHVIDSLAIGGAQKLLVTFAREARRNSLRCEVICLSQPSASTPEAELAAAGATLVFFPARRLLDPARLVRLVRHLRRSRPDVVQTHLTYANILGGLAGRLAGLPVAGTLHSAGVDRRYSRLREWLESRVLRWLDARVIAVGEQTAQSHRRRLGGQALSVLYNAVELPPPLPPDEREMLRRAWSVGAEDLVLISAGRFSTVKAYDDLLRAFADLRASRPGSLLLLVGDGVMRPDWERLAAELGVADAVRFLGRRDDVPTLLRASDLYAASSIVEGAPLSVMEAMAAGLPVVATAVGDLPVLVGPGCGVLVPPRDPHRLAVELLRVTGDREKMRQMGANAREFAAAHFGSAAWFETLIGIYGEIQEAGR